LIDNSVIAVALQAIIWVNSALNVTHILLFN